MPDAAQLRAILDEILRLPDMIVVTGPPDVVTECMVRPDRVRVRTEGTWLAVEDRDWHVHLDAKTIDRLKFRRVPDAHDRTREALYVSFADAAGTSVLRVHFDKVHDAAGRLDEARVAAFEGLRARYGHLAEGEER